jgi:hypothetical protein
MAGRTRDMHVAELREAKAAAVAVSRARKLKKEKQARERKLAEKERDMERRKRTNNAPRAPPAHAPPADSKDKKWRKQLAALTAKMLDCLKVAD